MRKRSVTIDGHRTSVSLEDAFWTELLAIGDATAELARAELEDGRPARWRVTRVDGVNDRQGSQLEAVAVEAEWVTVQSACV